MPRKARVAIPTEIAARVLFLADRTCCVCRQRGKEAQIHHVDEDPSNNALNNLAVLCLECHNATQVRGGFGRKLDADQVLLYRDDWHTLVAQTRSEAREPPAESGDAERLELALSLAEIYREGGALMSLAMHYSHLGNTELRDKYIDLVLANSPDDSTIIFLRGMQDKPELVPHDVAQRQLDRFAKYGDKLQRARCLKTLGRHREAAADYVAGIGESLKDERVFSAAFYLKELAESGIITELFTQALGQASRDGDLWWQVRSLQELGWDDELDQLLIKHAPEISAGDNLELRAWLADARGDTAAGIALRKEMALQDTADEYNEREGASESEGSQE